ncbi:MAG: hypothetical protein JSR65_02375 [Proteobacteria bacterium]|nr:hypothetical protein [Pseudomonadota bacterium]
MNARCLRHLLALILGLLFVVTVFPTFAADKPAAKMPTAGTISDRWVVWPKADHAREFEAAIKEYVAWMKKAGDAFDWAAYQPIVGTDLTYYVFRSDGHQWKDFDAEEVWRTKADDNAQFEKLVGPHVAKVEHFFVEFDADHSHTVGNPRDYKYYQGVTYRVKPGAGADAMAAIDKIHKALQSQKWAYPYRLEWQTGGRDGLRIVNQFKSYADMADPTPTVREVLTKALGAEDAAATLKQFGSSLERVDDTIGVSRPDLSTQK